MCYKPNYKIYDKKKLLNEVINRREEDKGSIFTLFFELNHLSFALHFDTPPHSWGGVSMDLLR